jgi:SrtB family sortase
MKENLKLTKAEDLIHFDSYEETVIRENSPEKENVKKILKKKYAIRKLKQIISIVSAFAILVSAFFLGKRGYESLLFRSQEKNEEEYVIPTNVTKELDNMTEEEAWAYLYGKYPHLLDIVFPIGFDYNYALYYAENPDTIGYLKIPGTNIDTPVVQADNNKYYLNHDFYGKYTSYGAIYASYIDNFNVLDRNTLIYGHNMRDGTRFAALKNYKSMDYFLEHPIIEFNTLYEKHKWKIYAVIITNGNIKGDNGYFFDFTFNNCSDACFEEYLVELDKRKLYETGVDILPTDKLITLCTCTYEFNDARLIVIARMVREGESAEVDVSLAKKKDTPVKYPAAYYSHPSKNPYKDDAKWYLY